MTKIAVWSELCEGAPRAARAAGIDLVVLRVGDEVRVLYGRCPHRGALMAEGSVAGEALICRRRARRALAELAPHCDLRHPAILSSPASCWSKSRA